MATQFVWPEITELMEIDREFITNLTMDDPLFEVFPLVEKDNDKVEWEQQDVFAGLQNVRGLGGMPGRVRSPGGRRFEMDPGYYGDFDEILEAELTRRRKYGTFNNKTDITDLVIGRQEHLTSREISRVKLTAWTLLTTGAFSVTDEKGAILHTDAYPINIFTPSVPWSTIASATPLKDLRQAVATYTPGHYVKFDKDARFFANSVTVNNLLNNNNGNDMYGRRVGGGNSLNSLADANRIFLDNNLPQIVPYDEGYYDKPVDLGGVFSRYLPNGKGVLIGKRLNDAPVGEYQMTINANNPDAEPGSYLKVNDSADNSLNPVPRVIRVDKGHNGGPAIYFPSAVVVFNI